MPDPDTMTAERTAGPPTDNPPDTSVSPEMSEEPITSRPDTTVIVFPTLADPSTVTSNVTQTFDPASMSPPADMVPEWTESAMERLMASILPVTLLSPSTDREEPIPTDPSAQRSVMK